MIDKKEKWSHRFLASTASPQANVMPAIATGGGSGARVAAGTGVAGGEADSAVVFSGATPDTGSTTSAAIRRMQGIRVGEHTIRFIYFTMVRRDIMINGLSLRPDPKTTGFLTS